MHSNLALLLLTPMRYVYTSIQHTSNIPYLRTFTFLSFLAANIGYYDFT